MIYACVCQSGNFVCFALRLGWRKVPSKVVLLQTLRFATAQNASSVPFLEKSILLSSILLVNFQRLVFKPITFYLHIYLCVSNGETSSVSLVCVSFLSRAVCDGYWIGGGGNRFRAPLAAHNFNKMSGGETQKPNNLQVSDLLAEERASRKKQVAELQQRVESAECLAAERAVLRVSEHAARTRYNTELEGRVRVAESLAARRAEQIAELERCVTSARSQAGEHARRNAALERRADGDRSRFTKQLAEMQRRAEAAEAALDAERAKSNDDDDDEYAGEIII